MVTKPLRTPCADTPENREVLVQQLLDRATQARDLERQGAPSVPDLPAFLLVAAAGKLDHAKAGECRPDVFVVAEYARGRVTRIDRLHRDVVWALPPVYLRTLPRRTS